MKTILTIILTIALSVGMAQETRLKYVGAGFSRQETFDWQYGRYDKGPQPPFMLGIEKNGKYLTRSSALRELQKPIWGPEGNKKWEDLVPEFTPRVSKWIMISQYGWFSTADTLPSTEAEFGYEGNSTLGWTAQRMPLRIVEFWGLLGIYEWRPYNPVGVAVFTIENPMYPIVEAERAAQIAQYRQLLEETFVQLAYYVFPSFYSNKPCKWSLLYEGDTEWTEVPFDKQHWLASPTGGWIKIQKPFRPEEIRNWDLYIPITIELDRSRLAAMLVKL